VEGNRRPWPEVCPSRKRSAQEFQNSQNSMRGGRISRMSIYARGKLQSPHMLISTLQTSKFPVA